MLKRAGTALVVLTSVLFSSFSQAGQAWESYKSRFLMPDGRIIDTGNGNVYRSRASRSSPLSG
jgi:endoglucanase